MINGMFVDCLLQLMLADSFKAFGGCCKSGEVIAAMGASEGRAYRMPSAPYGTPGLSFMTYVFSAL